MPRLKCSEDNNHKESKLAFELSFKEADENWQSFELLFLVGEEKRTFKSIDKEELTHTGVMGKVGKFALALKPLNEINALIKMIEDFLANEKLSKINFEPADPSFEFILERAKLGQFKAYIWVDAGNTKQLEYTWDAQGLRFFTTKEHIESFISELKAYGS